MKRLAAWIICSLLSGTASAVVIYESAEFNPGFFSNSYLVNSSNYLGSRFTLTESYAVTHVGGAFAGRSSSGTIYAAIVPTDGLLPSQPPDSIVVTALASVVFAVPHDSSPDPTPPAQDLLISLEVVLGPGDYALVFGSGLFGSSGSAHVAFNQQPMTPEGIGSYFRKISFQGAWSDFPHTSNLRFVVEGIAVPEPSTLALLGAGLFGLMARRRVLH